MRSHEHVLERGAPLRQFAHRPMPVAVASRKISSRTSTPDSTRNENIFQSPSRLVVTSRTPEIFCNSSAPSSVPDFRFDNNAAGAPDFSEQIFRRIARLDSSLVNDDDAAASHLHFRENVRRKQNGVLFAQVLDQLAHLADLVWIEADGRFVENEKIGLVQQRVRQADPLAITFRQACRSVFSPRL